GSIALVFFVMLPMIASGTSPVLAVLLVSVAIIFLTHVLIAGFSRKSWIAMAGTFGGVVMASVLVYVVGASVQIDGMGTEEARILFSSYPDFDLRGILFAGIVLGALGAVMDVAISIASGLAEVKAHKPNVGMGELWKSGMNIGKDIMGSMLNTLIFAYIGAVLVEIVLFFMVGADLSELLNYGFIAEEVVRSLVGSLGLLVTIPLTAVLGGVIMGKRK
ncbi:YibE/F family protein, partial [Patescibacteria group bacterium]|nr:YibE/F family protein [Patescibacteria group bacterium]